MFELSTLIARHAKYRPDANAVVFENERLTYGEFSVRVNRVANMLCALGIGKGDKVATVLPNCRELLEIYWAVPTLGAVLVPLSPLLLPAGLASLLGDSEAKCVITQRSLLSTLAALGDAARPLAGRILLIDSAESGCGDYRALTAAAGTDAISAATTLDDPFNIMYTSGTTGLPKGIMHTHYIRSMYCLLMTAAWRMTPEAVVMHSGAIVFNGAFVTMMPAFYLGAKYVLLRQFDAERVIETIEREHVTHTMLVPSQIIALLNSPRFTPEKLASLEMILSLGAPLLKEYKDRLNQLLPNRFYELYGLTEGFMTILDRDEAMRKSGSVGVPPPFFDIRIARDDGTPADTGEVGEILGRSPILLTGYYRRPDLTAEAVRDGWLHTGDMGYLDAEGYLYLVDRKKDMIDRGGVKIYPRDVEEIAAQHPAVREVAVFGVPHEKLGETPIAAVILREPEAVTANALRDWINERVAARYQRVRQVVIMRDFPRSTAGKTLKRELRAPYWAGRKTNI